MASVQTDPVRWDALVVINQRTELARVAAAAGGRWQRVQVLSSHRPFPRERAQLVSALAPAQVNFATFPDLLDDTALAAIDDQTTRELLAKGVRAASHARDFQQRMSERRNEAAHRALPPSQPGAVIHAGHGLGVAWSYWSRQGAKPLSRGTLRERFAQSAPGRAISFWRNSRRLPERGYQVEDLGDTYLFAGTLKRLPLVASTKTNEVALSRATAAQATWIATTIHDHPPGVHRLGRPVRVFSDGYLPSNYSRSYLDSYGEVEFVACDPFAARWFRQCGRTVIRPPMFIEPRALAPTLAPNAIRTVIVLGGHGGDWSALIDRSDNDRLFELVAFLSRTFPCVTFRLRLHPTMDHALHDGCGARERVSTFVKDCALSNLTLSTQPWATDLAEGDAFISEYSATLIDAWRAGRPGLIANLTGRRSFMQDFADLGFAQTTDANGTQAWLEAWQSEAGTSALAQNAAIGRYNQLLAEHFSR